MAPSDTWAKAAALMAAFLLMYVGASSIRLRAIRAQNDPDPREISEVERGRKEFFIGACLLSVIAMIAWALYLF